MLERSITLLRLKELTVRLLAAGAISFGMGADQAHAVRPHTDPSNAGNWVLVDAVSDEFETNALDHTKWQICGKDDIFWANSFKGRTFNPANVNTMALPGGEGGWQYSPDNIAVSNGLLKITTKYEPGYDWYQPGSDVWTHTTAGMWSKETFTYGYMEIRCKLANEKQTGAFWTTGDQDDSNVKSELDVFEAIGQGARTNKMWSSIHDWAHPTEPNNAWTETTDLASSFSDGFHTYAAEWDETSVKIYADGFLIYHVTKANVESGSYLPLDPKNTSTRWPMDGGQHVWADSEIFEWWGIPDPSNPASDFEVDYIRVWQKGPAPDSPWDAYVSSYDLSGGKTHHSDADHLNDWEEYVVGGNPTNPADTGTLPIFDASSSTYAFSLRNDSSLVAYLCVSTNLVDASWATNETITVSSSDGMMSNYVATIGMSENQQFMKLTIAESNVPPVVPTYHAIISGPIGNGDLQNDSPASGAHSYQNTPSWFNASGADTVDAISDNATNGSSQPTGTHALLPYTQRVQLNDSGYTIVASGEVFSLSYEFGANGGPANWNGYGDETMRTFLFTSAMPVDGNTSVGNMTELGEDVYPIDRAGDGQWTSRTVSNFYTTSASDIGKTVYFGLEFDGGIGNTLYPRIDVIQLEVNK